MSFSAIFSLLVFLLSPSLAVSADDLGAELEQDLKNRKLDPGRGVFIRVFKEPVGMEYPEASTQMEKGIYFSYRRARMELWVMSNRTGRLELYKDYPASYAGELGPKLKQGDHQAPEGFYEIKKSGLNPGSQYTTALNYGYPNKFDVRHGRTGSLLEIHGGYKTDGCFALGDFLENKDQEIIELYSVVKKSLNAGNSTVPLHIFPFPMTPENLKSYSQQYPENAKFWSGLSEGYAAFERTGNPPKVSVSADGSYVFRSSGSPVPAPVQTEAVATAAIGAKIRKEGASPSAGDNTGSSDALGGLVQTGPKEAIHWKAPLPAKLREEVEKVSFQKGNTPAGYGEAGRNFAQAQETALAPAVLQCLDPLSTVFSGSVDREKAESYIKTQGQLALYRVTWASLALQGKPTESIEGVIDSLLAARDPAVHKEFLTRSVRLSDRPWILPAVEVWDRGLEKFAQASIAKRYHPVEGDIKALALLADAEEASGGADKVGVKDFLRSLGDSNLNKNILNEVGTLAARTEGYWKQKGCSKNGMPVECHEEERVTAGADIPTLETQATEMQELMMAIASKAVPRK